jgi:hypothetical protein
VGEDVYGSDRVAVRFGRRFLAYGGALTGTKLETERVCDFRLIPSQSGFVPAGSSHQAFAIYSITANRYLLYSPLASSLGFGTGLLWMPTGDGAPPGGVPARADFIPVDLFFLSRDDYSVVYLTIQNIGNVTTSRSQQEMKVIVQGQEWDFLVIPAVASGAKITDHFIFGSRLVNCDLVTVALDTKPGLKFQIGRGAFSNSSVFVNDKRTFYGRDLDPPRGRVPDPPVAPLGCEPPRAH